MKWSKQKERLHRKSQSMNSLQEKINYYYSSSERDTKDLENLKNSTGLKNHILDELTELVERV